MDWSDEGKSEIKHQQQQAQKSESDGGSTQSKSGTKFNKPKTEVHRTQFIYGLKGQKAAAERRRFDVNKFINSPPKSNHASSESEVHDKSYHSDRNILDQGIDSDSSSGYSRNSRSSVGEFVHESYREEEESRRYDSELIERYTSSDDSSYCSSTPHSKDNYDDDMYSESKSGGHKCCCGQAIWSSVAFAAAFLIMIIAGTVVLFSGAFRSDLVPSSDIRRNTTYLPSSAPTGIHSGQPSHVPSKLTTKTPSIAPSRRPIYWPTGGPSGHPSHVPSKLPSNTPSIAPSRRPTYWPTGGPSKVPSNYPSSIPTLSPTEDWPSVVPSFKPSASPTTNKPSYMPTETNQWFEIRGRLDGDTKIGDYGYYGQSVSLSNDGNTLAVAALANDEVEVYDNVSGQWVLRGDSITAPPDPANKPLLVAMEVYLSANGNIVAVGGWEYNNGRGLVRVFQWNGTSWSQMGQTLFGIADYDYFGVGLALSTSGLDMAVGARRTRSMVYHFDGAAWVQRGSSHTELISSGLAFNQDSIAITDDGAYYAVSAMRDEFALVFKWDGNDWVQIGSTLEPEVKNDHKYGSGIELIKLPSGNLVVAVVMTTNGGEVRIYDYDVNLNGTDSDWVERSGRITSPGSLSMGYSLEMSSDGNTIVTCTYKDVVIFDWDESEWIPRGTVLSTSSSPHDHGYGRDFWLGMSGDGSIVAVGMPFDYDTFWNGANLGQVRTFSMQRPW